MGFLVGKQYPIAKTMCDNGVQEACDLVSQVSNLEQKEVQEKFSQLLNNPSYRSMGGDFAGNEFETQKDKRIKAQKNVIEDVTKKPTIGATNKRKGTKKFSIQEIKDKAISLGYDAPEIREFTKRVEAFAARPTMSEDGKFIPEFLPEGQTPESRQAFNDGEVKKYTEKQLNNGKFPVRYERQAVFVLGMPGAGKSSQIADVILPQLGGVLVDADEFKELIPEYKKDGAMVSAIHEESSKMTKDYMKGIIDKGANAVFATVGSSPKSLIRKIQEFKNAGYNITVTYGNIPLEGAMKRNLRRYWQLKYRNMRDPSKKKARLVLPMLFSKNDDFEINNTYDAVLSQEGLVDDYAEINLDDSPATIGPKSDGFNFNVGAKFEKNQEEEDYINENVKQFAKPIRRVK
jgi:hypothetical protein